MTDRAALETQIKQSRRDLEELEQQVAEGDIDLNTADRLRSTYRREMEATATALKAISPEPPTGRKRQWSTTLILAVAVVIGVTVAAGSLTTPTTTSTTLDLSTVSNEAMEAVIASTPPDTPGIERMRLALGNRYFEERNYQAALPHYLAIAESDVDKVVKSEALARIGWMTFDGNNETEIALQILDDALALTPDSSFVKFLKARVIWCGLADPGAAVPLFREVLDSSDLPSDQHDVVAADLAVAEAGGTCMR